VAAYFAWLGWHADPYESWQVMGLALTLAAVAAIAGWRHSGRAVVGTATLVLTLTWAADAASEATEDADLWPVGMVLVFIGAALGLSLVAFVALVANATMASKT
jgi:hypothetical protein